jgi:hypothetical protein
MENSIAQHILHWMMFEQKANLETQIQIFNREKKEEKGDILENGTGINR